MKKFRKNNIEVEAEVWEGTYSSWQNLNSMGLEQRHIEPGEMGSQSFYIKTKDGPIKCEKGDFVVKESLPNKDMIFYPCKPDIFNQAYEEANKQ